MIPSTSITLELTTPVAKTLLMLATVPTSGVPWTPASSTLENTDATVSSAVRPSATHAAGAVRSLSSSMRIKVIMSRRPFVR